jgi:hypothetical protein
MSRSPRPAPGGYAQYKAAVAALQKSAGVSENEADRRVRLEQPELWRFAKGGV